MKIEINYIDSFATTSLLHKDLSLPCFLKHAAVAGRADYLSFPGRVTRALGVLAANHEYFDLKKLRWRGFQPLPPHMTDPTEQGDFSTIVGRAVADYLAKTLVGAKLTHSYEAAMLVIGYPLKGTRPDFYCVTSNEQFALEAKGYTKQYIGNASMAARKKQAAAGPIPVNFSIASVTYNLFGQVKCKFHDPVAPNTSFNYRLNSFLASIYYETIFQQVSSLKYTDRIIIDNREYNVYELPTREFQNNLGISVLIPTEIKEPLPQNEYLQIPREQYEDESVYIDSDGIGILIR